VHVRKALPSPVLSPHFSPLAQQTSLRLLQKKFPDSARVGRLEGMICEAEGDFEQAAKVYLDLRERYPTDPVSFLYLECQLPWAEVGVSS